MSPEGASEPWPSIQDVVFDPSALDIEAAPRLRFVLQQSFRYRYAGPVRNVDQRLVVVPPQRHGAQRRKAHRIVVVGGEGHPSWSHDDFANAVAHVSLPSVDETVEFVVDAVIDRSGREPALLAESALREPRYLAPTALTTADERILGAANDAARGATSGLETAERLSALVHRSLAYRKGATSVSTTAAEAFALGAGVCQDHAHVMLAMCRALGLPARYVSGHLLGEGATHAWVEVILPHPSAEHAVAIPLDPCHGRQPGAAYVTVAVGRDYRDVAPTSGTYVGRFANQLTSSTRLGVAVVDELELEGGSVRPRD